MANSTRKREPKLASLQRKIQAVVEVRAAEDVSEPVDADKNPAHLRLGKRCHRIR
jgi:hypothetical protein